MERENAFWSASAGGGAFIRRCRRHLAPVVRSRLKDTQTKCS